jgi:hypothetical protein
MTVFRYGALLIVGIMILSGCGSRAAKDPPVDRQTLSGAEQERREIFTGCPQRRPSPEER